VQSHVIACWGVILGAVFLSSALAIYSFTSPETNIGKEGISDDLIIIGLIFDICGVTIVLIPELSNRVKRYGKKGDEAIAVVSSQKIGTVDRYSYVARGFFFLIIGFVLQIIGNLLSN